MVAFAGSVDGSNGHHVVLPMQTSKMDAFTVVFWYKDKGTLSTLEHPHEAIFSFGSYQADGKHRSFGSPYAWLPFMG